MDNQKKLELTICGMLPYGLKCSFSTDEIYTLNGIVNKDLWVKELTYPADSFLCKPHLHSLDKLTEPILDGGLIPIVELAKTAFKDWKWNIINNMCVSKIEEANYYFQFNEGVFECFSFNKGGGITGMYFGNHLNLFEKLKEWHFNIYDLPKEMYIEKSESNGK